jgi:hypothetical protein
VSPIQETERVVDRVEDYKIHLRAASGATVVSLFIEPCIYHHHSTDAVSIPAFAAGNEMPWTQTPMSPREIDPATSTTPIIRVRSGRLLP